MSKHRAPSMSRGGNHRGPTSWSLRPVAALGASVATTLVATMLIAVQGQASAAPQNLVVNAGFEHGAQGWRTNDATKQRLTIVKRAHKGLGAAKLTTAGKSTVVLNDRVNSVSSTKAGETYRARAWVKAVKGPLSGELRLRERNGDAVLAVGKQPFRLSDKRWHKVRLTYQTRSDGAVLDLNVLAWHVAPRSALLVDSVRLIVLEGKGATPARPTTSSAPQPSSSSASPGSPTPTTSSPETPTPSTSSSTATSKPTSSNSPTSSPGCARFPGDPCSGMYYGASVDGGDPTTLEAKLGGKLALFRSYMQATTPASKFVSRASTDVANGRVPLISTKVPGSWAEVASGAYDDWLLERIKGLATVKGPVWLCLHHEPTNDGNPADWVKMQQHARKLIDANSSNIALVGILNGWDFRQNNGNPDVWYMPVGTGVDVMGFDGYNPWSPTNGKKWVEPSEIFSPAVTIAKWGYPTLVGEYGVRRDPANPGKAAEWMRAAYDYAAAHDFVAMSYFDSAQNSPDGSWQLDAETLPPFAQQLRGPHTATLR